MNELKLRDDRKEKQNRSPLSPRLRYNVLRRDGFTCQYCGRTGQERELEIDHIIPVSKGGTNDIENLQTSCKECNRGKIADELLPQQSEIKVIEKIVEKIVYKEPQKPRLEIVQSEDIKNFIKSKSYIEIAKKSKLGGNKLTYEQAKSIINDFGYDFVCKSAAQDINPLLKITACEALTALEHP